MDSELLSSLHHAATLAKKFAKEMETHNSWFVEPSEHDKKVIALRFEGLLEAVNKAEAIRQSSKTEEIGTTSTLFEDSDGDLTGRGYNLAENHGAFYNGH